MSGATTDLAEFLKTADRFATTTDAGAEATWGEDAADVSQASVLVDPADAAAENARVLAYTSLPRARDRVSIVGIHPDFEGETVTLSYDGRLGVEATIDMLVLAATVDRGANRTTLEGEVLL